MAERQLWDAARADRERPSTRHRDLTRCGVLGDHRHRRVVRLAGVLMREDRFIGSVEFLMAVIVSLAILAFVWLS
jgi:hypothetical protein